MLLRLSVQFFAHKKGVGSTKNGRDSESKRLGVKRADGQFVQAGSIIVDMAVSTGGNVEGSDPAKEVVTDNGVIILPGDELQRQVPWDASKMLSGNIYAFLTHFYNKETKEFEVKMTDEIMKGRLLTQGGAIIHERFKEA